MTNEVHIRVLTVQATNLRPHSAKTTGGLTVGVEVLLKSLDVGLAEVSVSGEILSDDRTKLVSGVRDALSIGLDSDVLNHWLVAYGHYSGILATVEGRGAAIGLHLKGVGLSGSEFGHLKWFCFDRSRIPCPRAPGNQGLCHLVNWHKGR